MTENADDDDDFSVFIRGDRLRSTSAPWRLKDYADDGPLDEAQISELSQRFGVEAATLRKLSTRLGFALNPSANPHLVATSRRKSQASALDELADAQRHLGSIERRLVDMIKSLSQLTDGDWFSVERYPTAFGDMLHRLEASLDGLRQSKGVVEEYLASPGAVMKWAPLDRRNLTDRRRDDVLGAIFQSWVDCGRTITFTTDPVTSRRQGELIDFSQAVCLCLTDPPTEIKSETIAKTILARGKWYRPNPERMITEWLSVRNGLKE